MTVLRWSLLAAVVVVAMVFASLTAEPSAWVRTVEWVRTVAAAQAGERAPCPSLVSSAPLPGSREAAYRRAGDIARALPALANERLRVLLETRTAWPLSAADVAMLAPVRPAVDALCVAAATEPEALRIDRLDPLDPIHLLDAVRAAAVLARAAPGDAGLAPALAGLTCGVDLTAAQCPALGAFCVGVVADALDDGWLAGLSADALPRLAAALHLADAAFPWAQSAPAAHAVHYVEFLASGAPVEPHDIGMANALLAWDHGFSVRLAGMDRAIELVAAVRRFEADTPADEPWAARQTRLAALARADRERNSDLFLPFLHAIVEIEAEQRLAAAKLRLLRLAVAVRAGGAAPRLIDPLTSQPFTIEPGAAGTVLRGGDGLRRSVARD